MNAVLIDRLRRLGASSESEIVNHDSREHQVVEVPVWILDELLIHLEELERGRGRRMTKIGWWTNHIAEALADPENTLSKTEWLARAGKEMRLKEPAAKSLRSSVDRKLRKSRSRRAATP